MLMCKARSGSKEVFVGHFFALLAGYFCQMPCQTLTRCGGLQGQQLAVRATALGTGTHRPLV